MLNTLVWYNADHDSSNLIGQFSGFFLLVVLGVELRISPLLGKARHTLNP
jgi:hypothetical protein